MICPECNSEPLEMRQYIWKKQAVTLTCSHCSAKLKMAPSTVQIAFLAIIFMAICGVLAGGGVTYLLLRWHWIPGESARHPGRGALVIAIVLMVIASVGGGYLTRLILWRMPYIRETLK